MKCTYNLHILSTEIQDLLKSNSLHSRMSQFALKFKTIFLTILYHFHSFNCFQYALILIIKTKKHLLITNYLFSYFLFA